MSQNCQGWLMKTPAESRSRPNLSIAMIVRDEQEVLAESIESVRQVADEIVILDTGSIDRTPELAAQLGATVHRTPWESDFSAARNRCHRLVNGNWVLWLDAGERLDSNHIEELRRVVDEGAKTTIAYSVWVEAPPHRDDGSAEQCSQLRLLPIRAGLRFSGRVRETLGEAIVAAGLQVVQTTCRIFRHARYHEPHRLQSKARRDLALANKEAETMGIWLPRLLLAAGQSHCLLGQQDQAREMLRRDRIVGPRFERAAGGLLRTLDDFRQRSGVARQPVDGVPRFARGLSFRPATPAGLGQLHAGSRATGFGNSGIRRGCPIRPDHVNSLAPSRGS